MSELKLKKIEMPITYLCLTCGSEDLIKRSEFRWNRESQAWQEREAEVDFYCRCCDQSDDGVDEFVIGSPEHDAEMKRHEAIFGG
jgi:hypothetical protein